MVKLPIFRARELMRILESIGFSQARQTGSHIIFKHLDGRTTLVPRHDRETIGRGLLGQILRQIEMSQEEFSKYL